MGWCTNEGPIVNYGAFNVGDDSESSSADLEAHGPITNYGTFSVGTYSILDIYADFDNYQLFSMGNTFLESGTFTNHTLGTMQSIFANGLENDGGLIVNEGSIQSHGWFYAGDLINNGTWYSYTQMPEWLGSVVNNGTIATDCSGWLVLPPKLFDRNCPRMIDRKLR